ncbi:MAG: UPF0280 family protein [Planctomycetes bacterium]|nr:UPF0280 family protein [Planctomycetota bacterium]
MTAGRTYRRFAHKGANFRICTERFEAATAEIVRRRAVLEAYLAGHRAFGESLAPVAAREGTPEVARWMAEAAAAAGVGPMAAVAGAMAAYAARAAMAAGATEAVVENGGDLVAITRAPLVVGLYTGAGPLAGRLALAIEPRPAGLAICSSSGRMGHSLSLGACDLATVVAADAALADAAATRAGNLVRTAGDIDGALQRIMAIPGIDGVLLVKDDRIGLAGHPGRLVAHRDAAIELKVTRDPLSQ